MIGLLLFTYCTPNYYDYNYKVGFEVAQGQTLNSVIDSLYSKKIIPSKINMKIAALLYRAERGIKAGRYEIPNGLTYFGMIELLLTGVSSPQKLVTIQEGIWQHNLAGLMRREFGVDSTRFMKLSSDKVFLHDIGIKANSAEGYLLPETYYLYDGATSREIITKLKREMDMLFEPDSVKEQMKKLGMTKHQILTLASVIDGETNISEEFTIISGVYHNRLKRGMKLQADPTVQYLIRNRKRHNRILYKDLEIDSKYNTYMYPGLPPGPINNPGKEAVMAAIFPDEHNFLFFVADGRGGHRFAKTLSQHQKNVALYRKWRRTQR